MQQPVDRESFDRLLVDAGGQRSGALVIRGEVDGLDEAGFKEAVRERDAPYDG